MVIITVVFRIALGMILQLFQQFTGMNVIMLVMFALFVCVFDSLFVCLSLHCLCVVIPLL